MFRVPAILAAVSSICMATSSSLGGERAVVPLPQAHAHNDYRHQKPLLDALDHGFCSVEADVFLVGGQLLVGHDRSELTPQRTFESLYLAPLTARVGANGGRVNADGPPVTLLIDIKTNGPSTWPVLHEALARHAEIFTRVENGRVSAYTDFKGTSVFQPGKDADQIDLETPRPPWIWRSRES